MLTSITKYVIIGLSILLVAAVIYGLWERGAAIDASAAAKASAGALTQAQSDLLIARSASKADAKISTEVEVKLDINYQVNVHYIEDRDQIERTDHDVATYLNTPIPDAYRRLLNAPDRVQGSSGAASGEPASAPQGAGKPNL